MKRQQLQITVIDLRRPEDSPRRTRVQTYTDHKAYLRDMSRIARTDAAISERTETTVTLYPRGTKPGLFDHGHLEETA